MKKEKAYKYANHKRATWAIYWKLQERKLKNDSLWHHVKPVRVNPARI